MADRRLAFGEETVVGYNPEVTLYRRVLADGIVLVHTGEQYAAAQRLDQEGLAVLATRKGKHCVRCVRTEAVD